MHRIPKLRTLFKWRISVPQKNLEKYSNNSQTFLNQTTRSRIIVLESIPIKRTDISDNEVNEKDLQCTN